MPARPAPTDTGHARRGPGVWLRVCLLAGLGVLSAGGWLDRTATDYTGEGFERALIAFGVARSLNAVISVLKETEVSLQVGIGVTTSPGEILDPVNDLIERFSWVVLASGTSLGVQQLLARISASPGLAWTVAALAIMLALVVLGTGHGPHAVRRWLTPVVVIALVLRFTIPAAAVASELVYRAFLSGDYASARVSLESATEDLEALRRGEDAGVSAGQVPAPPQSADEPAPEAGLAARIGRTVREQMETLSRQAGEVAGDVTSAVGRLSPTAVRDGMRARIETAEAIAASMSEDVIRLIAIFVVQTLLLPLVSVWVAVRIIGAQLGRLTRIE